MTGSRPNLLLLAPALLLLLAAGGTPQQPGQSGQPNRSDQLSQSDQGVPIPIRLPYSRLLGAASEPHNWLSYSGGYNSQRYSTLDHVNTSNVDELRPVWLYQTRRLNPFETSPLVVDGIMYISEPPTAVSAIDARTGRRLWHWRARLPENVRNIGFPQVNRGVALLEDTVFVGTLDARLVALDARSGAVRWQVDVADNATGHSITMAPLALDGKVIVGISGGEAGIRGFVDAYDAGTGERLWRFWTIPDAGEPGVET